jgi:serine/threonine-protein kinase
VAAVGLLSAAPVQAQAAPRDRAAADALFTEAKGLMESERFAEACPKLQESQRLDPAIGTLMYLAYCQEKAGQPAAAWATFRAAESAARQAKQAERERKARERAEALEATLPSLSIEVPEESRVTGLQIERDGVLLEADSYGRSVRVDPGTHVVSATAPGRKPWKRDVQLAAARAQETLTIPVLELDKPLATTEAAAAPAPTAEAAKQPGTEASASLGPSFWSQRNVGYIVGAAGVVGLAAGGYFAWLATSKEQRSDRNCAPDNPTWCNEKGIALNQEAQTAQRSSIISFAAGGVATAAGLVLVLTAPRAKPAGNVSVAPSINASGGTVFVTGKW